MPRGALSAVLTFAMKFEFAAKLSSIYIYIYTHTHTHTYIYIYIYIYIEAGSYENTNCLREHEELWRCTKSYMIHTQKSRTKSYMIYVEDHI